MTVGGNSAYERENNLPRLVSSAIDLATGAGFDHSCAPEQGRLLSVLARGRSGGRIGETGTGCGVGLAWMVEAAGPGTSFVSIEVDEARAAAAAKLFAPHKEVCVLHGDWTRLAEHGPFDMLVLDGGGKGKPPDPGPPLDPAA